jgi:pimeloyl-ACP methyl ester carboxylesterase
MPADVVSLSQDDGLRLAADLVLPNGEPKGSVILCSGFRGTRMGGSSLYVAERFAQELGWAALLIDYTGFGDSGGPRGRFDPEQQVRDIRSAASYLLGTFDGRPVSIYGNSFGAGMATVAAARDRRLASLFSLCAFSSGAALMKDQRPHWQMVEFEEALERDSLARVVSGKSALVDPDIVMVRDREATAYIANLAAAGKADRSHMHLVDAERLHRFRPLDEAAALRGRPAFFVHCERDYFMPAWHSRALAEEAQAPWRFLPYGHYAPTKARRRRSCSGWRPGSTGRPSPLESPAWAPGRSTCRPAGRYRRRARWSACEPAWSG